MKRRVLLIFLAVALMAFGACARVPEEEEVEPIKVGAPIPLTGSFAADGEEMVNGITMAIEDITAEGGVLGRPLEVVVFDIKEMLPEDLTSAANTLILREKVDVLVTGYGDTGADVRAFGQYDMPYFHADTTKISKRLVREHPEYNNCFMLCDDSGPYGWRGFDIITEELPYECPNHKAAVIYVDYEYNIVTADTFKEEAAKKGWEVVVDEMIPWGVREWGPILSKIRATDPAIILFAHLTPVAGTTFLHQFLERPTDSIICGTYFPAIPEFRELAGEAANGYCWVTMMGMLPTPEAKAWIARYEQRFGREPAMFGSAGPYDALHMWKAAVERVGDVEDYDAVCAAIRDPDYAYTGLCGTYSYDPLEQMAVSGEDLIPMLFYQIQNMEHVLISPEKYAYGEFEVPPWIGS